MSTIDEIARFAGELGMKKIVITDHSQATQKKEGFVKKSHRSMIHHKRWENVHNNVQILFGVEADLLNEKGDVCFDIQGYESDFNILSHHMEIYSGDKGRITEGFIKAIQKYHEKINMIGHIFLLVFDGLKLGDMAKVVEEANKYKIPLELNCRYLNVILNREQDKEKAKRGLEAVKLMLAKADQVYVNSDAHSLSEIRDMRKIGFEFLKKEGLVK
jgi:histidinol phosphatase-like PHP family hydrolase